MDVKWTGNLDDDCTAYWHGLILRAEVMDEGIWWRAVTDQESREELSSSNLPSAIRCTSGAEARREAEQAASYFRESSD
jgi:hypothetical protein